MANSQKLWKVTWWRTYEPARTIVQDMWARTAKSAESKVRQQLKQPDKDSYETLVVYDVREASVSEYRSYS